jgi:hypothetical protein
MENLLEEPTEIPRDIKGKVKLSLLTGHEGP